MIDLYHDFQRAYLNFKERIVGRQNIIEILYKKF